MLSNSKPRCPLSTHLAFRTLAGNGFEIRRAIPSNAYEAIGPFIFLDHFGRNSALPGEARGAPEHPHAGIETLTLLLEGLSVHSDSLGNESTMRPGDVQWMRAGRGIVRAESQDAETLRHGSQNQGIQLWLNMPKGHKHDAPAYKHFAAHEIPMIEGEKGVARLVSGRSAGLEGPLRSFGNPFVAHISLKSGGTISIDASEPKELALFVLTGSVGIGGQTIASGYLARLSDGETADMSSDDDSEIIIVGGAPLDAPIVRHGPLVMNTINELEQAVREYQSGRMGQISHRSKRPVTA